MLIEEPRDLNDVSETSPRIAPKRHIPRTFQAVQEPAWVRRSLIGLALGFLGFFLLVPLITVFYYGLNAGLATYWKSFTDPDSLSAIKLTLLTAAIAVPFNLVFGVAASWCIAKF